jgi:hypothetical protein
MYRWQLDSALRLEAEAISCLFPHNRPPIHNVQLVRVDPWQRQLSFLVNSLTSPSFVDVSYSVRALNCFLAGEFNITRMVIP